MTCPRCDAGLPCRGIEIPRLHELIAVNPAYLSRLDPECVAQYPESTPDISTIPLAESLAILAQVRECRHKGEPGCGCGGFVRCNKIDRDVSRHECFECVKGGNNG